MAASSICCGCTRSAVSWGVCRRVSVIRYTQMAGRPALRKLWWSLPKPSGCSDGAASMPAPAAALAASVTSSGDPMSSHDSPTPVMSKLSMARSSLALRLTQGLDKVLASQQAQLLGAEEDEAVVAWQVAGGNGAGHLQDGGRAGRVVAGAGRLGHGVEVGSRDGLAVAVGRTADDVPGGGLQRRADIHRHLHRPLLQEGQEALAIIATDGDNRNGTLSREASLEELRAVVEDDDGAGASLDGVAYLVGEVDLPPAEQDDAALEPSGWEVLGASQPGGDQLPLRVAGGRAGESAGLQILGLWNGDVEGSVAAELQFNPKRLLLDDVAVTAKLVANVVGRLGFRVAACWSGAYVYGQGFHVLEGELTAGLRRSDEGARASSGRLCGRRWGRAWGRRGPRGAAAGRQGQGGEGQQQD